MENEPRKRHPRKTKRRKLWIPIVFALAVVAGVIFFATRDKEETTPTAPGTPNKTVIHLAAGGDLNVTDDVVAATGSDGSYRDAFMDVLPLLSSADLSVLNLEGIFNGEPYGSEDRSAPASLASALASAGVDLLQLANSCSIRGGISGLISTITL